MIWFIAALVFAIAGNIAWTTFGWVLLIDFLVSLIWFVLKNDKLMATRGE